ncbi:MAG: M23 family metallopeptidase [Defluviitaleaceae bacterium]|nr:M23 family metallopeptidase [Defluviitaleaceae bacterium]
MKSITIGYIFNRACKYNDHPVGELQGLGDDLGRDCVIEAFVNNGNGFFMAAFKNSGLANEDWFGWGADVLAPVGGIVADLYLNPADNIPGAMNPSRASALTIKTPDNTHICLVHICNPLVKIGDTVAQGQIIAKLGNNGYSRCPHIHIGAWRDNEPLAIEFDRQSIADIQATVGEEFWLGLG